MCRFFENQQSSSQVTASLLWKPDHLVSLSTTSNLSAYTNHNNVPIHDTRFVMNDLILRATNAPPPYTYFLVGVLLRYCRDRSYNFTTSSSPAA
eukprot:m.107294 g.107294  ORF g.107294 m.107294 type:complete len:94 (-) comp10619_c1_seq3:977-1258(-)